jgi:hypothetical protein
MAVQNVALQHFVVLPILNGDSQISQIFPTPGSEGRSVQKQSKKLLLGTCCTCKTSADNGAQCRQQQQEVALDSDSDASHTRGGYL